MDMYNFDNSEIFCFKKKGCLIVIVSKYCILIFSLLNYETYLQIHHNNVNTYQNDAEYTSKWSYWGIIQMILFNPFLSKKKK